MIMNFIYLFVILAPLVLGEQLLGGNHCTWGPSYWCKHIDSAKECGAVDHCVNNVWQKEKLPELKFQKGNPDCGYCQIVVLNVHSLLKHEKHENEISDILIESCDAMKQKAEIPICKKLATEYLHDIVTMLNKNMSPQKICVVLKLCTVKSKQSPQLLEAFSAKIPKQVKNVKTVDAVVCDECHKFMTYVKTMISDQGSEALVEEYLNQLLCDKVPSELNAVCKELVKEMVPKVVALIKADLSANDICKMIGVCTSKNIDALRSIRSSLYKLHVHKPTVKGFECDYCEKVITEIRSFIADKDDQTAIENFVKSKMCSHLGALAIQCKTYVNEFMPEILDLLKSELDPKSVCSALGACSKSAKQIKYPNLSLSTGVKASPSCEVCQTVMAYLESLLKKNATEQDIIRLLDKICLFLPKKDKNECDSLIQQYTPLILQLLAAELKPSEICAVIHLCTSESDKIIPKKSPLVGVNPCTWGPSYWCKTEKHALSCGPGAHKHCKERVWNKEHNLKFHPDRL